MKDIHIIRELAAEYAQAANSDQNREKIRLHTAVNDLQMIRPIVLIDEIPWGEMAIGEELTLRCEDEVSINGSICPQIWRFRIILLWKK